MIRLVLLLSALTLTAACDDEGTQSGVDPTPDAASTETDAAVADAAAADMGADMGVALNDPTTAGPHAVRYSLTELTVGDRVLPLGVWGPTAAATDTVALSALVDPARRETFDTLAAAALEGCVGDALPIALDAPMADGAWPVILYSHCHECLGVSGASVAHRLASWGYIVLAPDHTDNTLWAARDGTNVPLGPDFLPVRGADMIGVLDAAEAGAIAALGETADFDAVGIIGHSFGAVTAGWVAERDARIDAALILAAPIENPLLPGVTSANITVPTVMLLAVEDNSIGAIGNTFLRNNYEALGGPAMKVEIADAGHWSVSDLCGLVEAFDAGCGEGTRQTDDTPFSYLTPATGRQITANWAVALFGATLKNDGGAEAFLSDAATTETLDITRRQWP